MKAAPLRLVPHLPAFPSTLCCPAATALASALCANAASSRLRALDVAILILRSAGALLAGGGAARAARAAADEEDRIKWVSFQEEMAPLREVNAARRASGARTGHPRAAGAAAAGDSGMAAVYMCVVPTDAQ